MKLLVVGTMAFDAIESPSGSTGRILGGAATYIGLSAAVLGTEVDIISIAGEDFNPEFIELLKSKNIGTKGIEIVKGGKTFFWSGRYHRNLNLRDTLVTELNVLEVFNPTLSEENKNADILLLGNLHPGVQLSAINQCANRPKLVILDTMNFWMDTALDTLLQVIAKTDVICINDEEARQLAGKDSLLDCADAIGKMGPKTVIIKKGEHGAMLFHDGKCFVTPALPLREVKDPTGAGDTFVGGFASYLAKVGKTDFETMKAGIVVGSALASCTVEEFGTVAIEKVDEDKLRQRISDFRSLTHFTLEKEI